MAVVEDAPQRPGSPPGPGQSEVLLAVPGTSSLVALNRSPALGVQSPRLAIGPNDTIAVVWQEFAAGAGATRVFGRLMTFANADAGRTDGGSPPDGGVDAGADGGVSDGGLPPAADGGSDGGASGPDAGPPDAGEADAGLLPDGGADPGPLIFQPSCGCRTEAQVSWAVGLALLVARRRRRPHHPC
jgi:hypothetical protein